MITEIKSKDKVIAFLIDSADSEEGTHPVTDPKESLQLIVLKRGAHHIFAKHTHKIMDRVAKTLQEAIVVTKGKVLVTVCTRDGEDIGAYEVSSGQCLYLLEGGYKIQVLEDAAFYEFKNGPHTDDKILL